MVQIYRKLRSFNKDLAEAKAEDDIEAVEILPHITRLRPDAAVAIKKRPSRGKQVEEDEENDEVRSFLSPPTKMDS